MTYQEGSDGGAALPLQPQRDAEVDGADRRAEQEHILGSDILPHRAEQARDGDGEDMVHAQAEGKVFHHVRGRLAQLAHEHDVDGIEMVGEENEDVGGKRGGHAAPAAQRAVHDAGSGPRGKEEHPGNAGGLQHEPLLHTVSI